MNIGDYRMALLDIDFGWELHAFAPNLKLFI
jgi:hypothetical protein